MTRAMLALGIVLVTAAPASAGEEDVVNLKLRGRAQFSGQTVLLGDVLTLDGADEALVRRIADQPVCANPGEVPPTVVTHDQVARRLGELGVNLARVLLAGAARCDIVRAPTTPAGQQSDARSESGLLRPLAGPGTSCGATLADALRRHVSAELKDLGTAQVTFERAGQDFLQLTSPPWDFQITSRGREKLGLREFHVVIRGAGQTQRTVTVFARVRVARRVVVTLAPLNPGNFIRPDDVALETREFDQAANLGLGNLEEVIGQQVKRFVPKGELVQKDAVRVADLVVRARPVTVTNEGAGVQVRLSGTALDSGTFGDTVRVRLGDARREKQILRGIVSGLGTVRLVEDSQ